MASSTIALYCKYNVYTHLSIKHHAILEVQLCNVHSGVVVYQHCFHSERVWPERIFWNVVLYRVSFHIFSLDYIIWPVVHQLTSSCIKHLQHEHTWQCKLQLAQLTDVEVLGDIDILGAECEHRLPVGWVNACEKGGHQLLANDHLEVRQHTLPVNSSA